MRDTKTYLIKLNNGDFYKVFAEEIFEEDIFTVFYTNDQEDVVAKFVTYQIVSILDSDRCLKGELLQ